jgi:glutathione S-transferase
MDYYYAPLACSLAGHIVIREADLPIKLIPVSLVRKQDAEGRSLEAVSPKNQVPVLRFDDGRILTELSVILQVLADMAPERGYLQPRSTLVGQHTLEWLNFIATELHKQCLYPMFQRGTPAEVMAWAKQRLAGKLAIAAEHLGRHHYLAGEHFSVADAYLGWVLMLSSRAGADIAGPGPLGSYWARLSARPAFAECLELEAELYKSFA